MPSLHLNCTRDLWETQLFGTWRLRRFTWHTPRASRVSCFTRYSGEKVEVSSSCPKKWLEKPSSRCLFGAAAPFQTLANGQNGYQPTCRRIFRTLRCWTNTSRHLCACWPPYRSCGGILCRRVKRMNTSAGTGVPFAWRSASRQVSLSEQAISRDRRTSSRVHLLLAAAKGKESIR